MENEMTFEENQNRYSAACHAMQTGVAAKMEINPKETQAKHLRVGVNSVMCSSTALVRLLMDKGLIDHEELMKYEADEMEREVERYQTYLSEHYGADVKLG